MNKGSDDTHLILRIDRARQATLAWLDRLQVRHAPCGVCRISAAQDPIAWPGMLLPGTYNAILCRELLGGLAAVDSAAVAAWLLAHRSEDGVFRVPGMHDPDVFKRPEPGETWRYIDWHVTNYSLGALFAVAPATQPDLPFAEPYLDPATLKAWLADRDLRDPWLEGNNVVNLGSFLLLLRQRRDCFDRAEAALDVLFAWHDYHQEPATGFWGVGQDDPLRRLHAMAGSMHNYHLWYATNRPLPFHHRAVEFALSRPPRITSACIDVDLVDLLVHAFDLIDCRRSDTIAWLRRLLDGLLDDQNEDGGFCDEHSGVRRQDGWVHGYSEPQGLSNTFAAWFRWIAIAMIADLLWPGRWPWRFRRMIGIGFRKDPSR
jgi:hypothetical protein